MAIDFNGSTQYVERLSAPVTAAPLTLACWFKATSATACTVLSIGSSTQDDHIDIQPWSDNVLYTQSVNSGTGGFTTTAGTYTNGVWTHACHVETSSSSRTGYRDGGNSGSESSTVVPDALDVMHIGCHMTSGIRSQFFNGSVAEVAAWAAALDASEIAALGKGFSPLFIRRAALRLYWPGVRDATLDRRLQTPWTNAAGAASAHPRIINIAPTRSRRMTTAVGGGGGSFKAGWATATRTIGGVS